MKRLAGTLGAAVKADLTAGSGREKGTVALRLQVTVPFMTISPGGTRRR